MSEEFKLIYKILNTLRKALKVEEFDPNEISAATLGISEAYWSRLMKMLVDNDYIEGIRAVHTLSSDVPQIAIGNIQITLRGLEYLEDNTLMKRVANTLKGLNDINPLK